MAKSELALSKQELESRVDQMIKAQVLVFMDGSVRFMGSGELDEFTETLDGKKKLYRWADDDGRLYVSDLKDADKALLKKNRISMEEGVRGYFEKVVLFKTIEESNYEAILTMYWERGEFVEQLLKETKKYGGRTVENLAHDLASSAESVYKWRQFYLTYSKDRLSHLVAIRAPWRTVLVLLGAPSDTERRRLETAIAQGKMEHEDVVKEVKALNKAERESDKGGSDSKADRRGGSTITSICKGVLKLTGSMDGSLSEFLSACGSSEDLDAEAKDKARMQFAKVFEELESLHIAIGKALTVKKRYAGKS